MIYINKINKTYNIGDNNTEVILNNASLEIKNGEFVTLIGQSGIGKSTLLNIIGLIDIPDGGDIIINGVNIFHKNDALKAKVRLNNIGFVYQFHFLMRELSILDNVKLPCKIAGMMDKKAKEIAINVLNKVNISEELFNKYPAQLSGGQKQRVAIARALVNNPNIILADEPTGNLDHENSINVIKLLINIAKSNNTTVLISTHNNNIAEIADRKITISNKQIVDV